MHVERVVISHLCARFDQAAVGALCAARVPGLLLNGPDPQRRQALDLHAGMARDPVERRRGLSGAVRTSGHHQRDRQLVETVQDVEHELERGQVGPVQVVDGQQGGARLGHARHHGEQTVRDGHVVGLGGRGQLLVRAGQ